MKHTTLVLIIAVILPLLLPTQGRAEGIRIVPHTTVISGDSLRITLEMDLNSVRVGSLTALYFTPCLDHDGQILSLPPVVITGSKRARFERRGQALSQQKAASPYVTIRDTRKTTSKTVSYSIAIPYAAWMQHASLLLSQEIKDCCHLRLLPALAANAPLRSQSPNGQNLPHPAPPERQVQTRQRPAQQAKQEGCG